MILDILVFVLGFLVAGLIALASLPAIWRRAMRLSGDRLSRLVPLSGEEIAAERDHLRAAHAVELRRTEQRLDRAEEERAALMAEASRREDRIAELGREGARTETARAAQAAEAARLRRDLDELGGEAGTLAIALHDASGLADKRWADSLDIRLENQRLAEQVDQHRASVAGLETRLLGATTRADDLARELAAAREMATTTTIGPRESDAAPTKDPPDASVTAAAQAAARALDQAHRREIEHLTHEVQFAHEQAASAERRAAEAAREIERLGAERDALAEALAGLEATKPDAPEAEDEVGRLRTAIGRLAEDIMRTTGRPEAQISSDAD